MTIPEGFFTTATQTYYGLDPLATEAEELWGEFVATLPAGTVIEPGDEAIQEQYVEFLSGKLEAIYRSEEKGALSPAEIEARKIIWTVFDILLTLLQKVTTLQIVNSDTLKFFTQYEKAYSDLMARAYFYIGSGTVDRTVWKADKMYGIPNYEGGDEGLGRLLESTLDARLTHTTPSEIASEFKLGYGDITLQEVFEYLYAQYESEDTAVGETVRYVLESPAWKDKDPNRPAEEGAKDQTRRNECEIELTKTAEGEIIINVNMKQRITTVAERTGATLAQAYEILVEKLEEKIEILNDRYIADYTINFPDVEEYITQIVPGLGDYQWLIDDINYAKSLETWDADFYAFRRLANQYLDLLTQVEVWSHTETDTLVDASKEEVLEEMNDLFQAAYLQAKTDHIVEIADPEDPTQSDYLSPWEQNITNDKLREAFIQFRDFKIPWDWGILAGGLASGQNPTDPQAVKLERSKTLRGELNQRMNTFIDTLDSKMQLIQDRTEQQREVVESAASARKMINEIIQTAIRQLQNILASIYK